MPCLTRWAATRYDVRRRWRSWPRRCRCSDRTMQLHVYFVSTPRQASRPVKSSAPPRRSAPSSRSGAAPVEVAADRTGRRVVAPRSFSSLVSEAQEVLLKVADQQRRGIRVRARASFVGAPNRRRSLRPFPYSGSISSPSVGGSPARGRVRTRAGSRPSAARSAAPGAIAATAARSPSSRCSSGGRRLTTHITPSPARTDHQQRRPSSAA